MEPVLSQGGPVPRRSEALDEPPFQQSNQPMEVKQMTIVKKIAGLALAAGFPLALTGMTASPAASTASAPHFLLPRADMILPSSVTAHATNAGPVNASAAFNFGVVLPSRDPAGLARMAEEVSNPKSPMYHHFLTHAQAMARFGPDVTLANQIIKNFEQAGMHATLQNQMVMVSGTVGQVNTLFNTQMTQYKQGSSQFVAPNSALTLPSWLRSAASLTGFAQGTPTASVPLAKHLETTWAPKSHMKRTPNGPTASASNGALSVTVTRITSGSRAPGLAVRYLVTSTLNGQPDPNATVENLTGPYAGYPGLVMQYDNPPAGQMVVDFTMSQQQTISMALTVVDPTTGDTATVQLPAASFVGPSAKATNIHPFMGEYGFKGKMITPLNPKNNNINNILNAQQLVQAGTRYESAGYAPSIGVYTAGGISSNGSYTGIGFGVPENDANMFSQKFHLPPEHFSVGYVGPNSYADPTYGGIEGEMSLDLQMMETSAPGSNITVYSAGSLRSALNQVDAQDAVSVFSISYGGGELVEELFSPGAQQTWDELAQFANLEGITISVSSGDSGAYSGAEYSGLVPNSIAYQPQASYPANSSWVTAVGGTENSVSPRQTLNEAAMWGGNIGSELPHSTLLQFLSLQNMIASGAISTVEPAPFYQTAFNPGLSGRMTPDISLPASVVTPGWFAFFDGSENLSGGTSAGAPLFAGWMADLATATGRVGNVNPALYYGASVPAFRLPDGPITTPVDFGNNGYYQVTSGDNAVSGLGQLNVDGFFGWYR